VNFVADMKRKLKYHV